MRRGCNINGGGILMSSIRKRLLVIIITLMVVSFGLLGGLSYYFSKQALSQSINETAMSIGTDYANRVNNEMQKRVDFLQDLSTNPCILSGDRNQIILATSEAFKRSGKFDTLTYIPLDGNALLVNGASVFLGDRDYFKTVINTKQPVISNPLIVKSTGKLSVNVAVPIMNNGILKGVLNGSTSLTLLDDLVKDIRFKDTGYGAIFDDSGLLIAHGKNSEIVGKLNLSDKTVNSELNLGIDQLDDNLTALF